MTGQNQAILMIGAVGGFMAALAGTSAESLKQLRPPAYRVSLFFLRWLTRLCFAMVGLLFGILIGSMVK